MKIKIRKLIFLLIQPIPHLLFKFEHFKKKIGEIFSFYSAHSASSIKTGSKQRVGEGRQILSWEKSIFYVSSLERPTYCDLRRRYRTFKTFRGFFFYPSSVFPNLLLTSDRSTLDTFTADTGGGFK